jgi:predicted nucleic acid-binding Zn ribbon protein
MRKAGEIISLLFKQRFGVDFVDNARSSSELFNSWEKIVCQVWPLGDGQKKEDIPAAAVHSRIKELERGVLIVEADHPGWIQILQTKQAELLQAIQSRCPNQDIRGIAFRLSKERN